MNTTESEDSHGNQLTCQGPTIKVLSLQGNANSQDSSGSLQLNLEETQNVVTSGSDPPSVSWLQPSNFPTPTSPQPPTNCVEKLKTMEREKNSPRLILDDSVIIDDTPEKKSVSVIDISDSSPMGDLNKSSGSVKEILSSSMSEILLGQNNLLYEECDNIDKVLSQLFHLNPPCDTFFFPGY